MCKKSQNIITLIFFITLMFGCEQEFDLWAEEVKLTGSYDEVAAVYANICPQKEVNFIRINRGFSVNNFFNANTNPDSLYFDPSNIKVLAHKLKGRDTIQTYLCRDTIIIKDSLGDFSTNKVQLYYFTSDNLLNASDEDIDFGLTIKTPEKKVTARTNLLHPIELLSANPRIRYLGFQPNHFRFKIGYYVGTQVMEINGISSFYEKRLVDNKYDTVKIVYKFPVGRTYISQPTSYYYDEYEYIVYINVFFSELERAILLQGDTLNTVERWMDRVYFTGHNGNGDYALVESFVNSISTGFNDELPTYSNIENGIGFISSYSEIKSHKLKYTIKAQDTIRNRMDGYLFK